jgi:hypothetical protein
MRLVRLPLAAAMLPVHLALGGTKGALRGAIALVRLGRQAVAGDEDHVAEADAAAWEDAEDVDIRTQPWTANGEPPEPVERPERVEPPLVESVEAPAPAEPVEAPAPAEPEPAHVSEEPELVAEVAEQGAEDGAGAEVEVEEPWPGYTGMRAQEVRARLATESSAVAAAVSLYEAQNKGRTSVLQAASGRMRGA